MTQGLVTAAVALCLVMAGALMLPMASSDVFASATYVDVLDDDPETLAYAPSVEANQQ